MNHRIVTLVVSLIVVVLAGTALGFAWAIQARVPASAKIATPVTIPHPISNRTELCTICHAGSGLPPTHRFFTDSGCRSCHATRSVALVPHSISMGDSQCPLCHGDPGSRLGMPSDHVAFKERGCLFCHYSDGAKASIEPRPAGAAARARPELTHPVSGAFAHCLYCHRIGSEPSLPANHRAFAEETCVSCHFPASVETTQP